MKSPVDIYTLKARIFPAFLLCLPVALAVTAWAPEAKLPTIALFGITGNVAVSFLVAERVRDQGKAKEPELWKSWGGPPTTQLLRHKNPEVSPQMRNTWRQALEELYGSALPTAASETKAPEKADQAYEAAVFRLRERTREAEKYPLVFKENVSYGFRRNLWALKPTGICLAGASTLACAAKIAMANFTEWTIESHAVIAFVACVVLLVWWLMAITKTWVRTPAFEYAKRLLGASILLEESRKKPAAVP
jgi:hypothetical protein